MTSSNTTASIIESFYRAVHELVTGRGDIRGRLLRARAHLAVIPADELPQELKKDFEWVLDHMAELGSYDRETPQIPFRRIRRSDGQKVAEQILAMFLALEKLYSAPVPEEADTKTEAANNNFDTAHFWPATS